MNELLNKIGFRGMNTINLKFFILHKGFPRYLEEIQPHLPVEANIHELCFKPCGILFRERTFFQIYFHTLNHKISISLQFLTRLNTSMLFLM